MAIGMQKLAAGSGYAYLTQQVAALDATDLGPRNLADYYTAEGESPGVWCGDGLEGVGLQPGDPVTEEQMKLLFGAGLHPVTGERLGQRYAIYRNEPTGFETELTRLVKAWADDHDGPVTAEVRDRLRTALAREWFSREFGRPVSGPRELHGFIAKATSHPRTSVAGFDLTFTPAKSVSALWAVADPRLAAAIRAAHDAAVAEALRSAQRHAVFTRQGHDGIRHVEVRGLIAAVFVHRDSRAGDPNLHTHVAIANKVQTLTGEWLALDATVLYRAKVSISEAYSTHLQARLTDLGLLFVATGRDGKRPVYEVAGVDPRLITRWSTRRQQITARTADLVAQFQQDHERPPTPVEKLALAQQATLDTRQAKHQPRSEAEQRATWRGQAERVLGPGELGRMLSRVVSQPRPARVLVDEKVVIGIAERVIAIVESERSSWTEFHIRSEALRQVRAAGVSLELSDVVADQAVAHALSPNWSMPITTRRVIPVEPPALRRRDGQSVYATPAATQYTSQRILSAERRLIDAASRGGGRTVDGNSVTFALLQSLANHEPLNPGQQLLVQEMATSGRQLQLAIAPAGTGKTTAMRALTTAWTSSGGNVLGLAPSAAAAEGLRSHLHDGTNRVVADNLAKLVWAIGHQEPLVDVVGRGTLVIIDEAGMADTLTLDHVVTWCVDRGAVVRLIGDDQQLGAIGAGGVLRDIAAVHGALHLDTVMRFADPAEAAATLALRAGDAGALGFYLDHDRIHPVDPDTATRSLLAAWQADRAVGLDALMLAPTRAQVAELNHAARAARLNGATPARETVLADGNPASQGDVVITRRNNRALTTSATAWVRNGDRWTITHLHLDGSLDVTNLKSHTQITLPADYVAASVELGYATTIHAAQGVTADTCHGLLSGTESRQLAYTMLSRGRVANHAWIQVSDIDHHTAPAAQPLLQPFTATQLLETVIARDDAPVSVTTLRQQADDPIRLLGPAVACYLDAITFAADHTVTHTTHRRIDQLGHALHITDEAAWPTLRSHLIQIAANGHDPTSALGAALGYPGSLATARDRAAVLDHRLNLTRDTSPTPGPLPWLPGIPSHLATHPEWGPYLHTRHTLTKELAAETRDAVTDQTPGWARDLPTLDPALVDDIRVWRAAHTIPDTDLRPTGPIQWAATERMAQHELDHRLGFAETGIRDWMPRIVQAAPTVAGDPRLPILAAGLDRLDRAGHDAAHILQLAARIAPLPDDHPADALGYRVTKLVSRYHLAPIWETYTFTDQPPARDPSHPGTEKPYSVPPRRVRRTSGPELNDPTPRHTPPGRSRGISR